MTTATIAKQKKEPIQPAETDNLILFNYMDKLTEKYWSDLTKSASDIFKEPKSKWMYKNDTEIRKDEATSSDFYLWTSSSGAVTASETAEFVFEDYFKIEFKDNIKNFGKVELNFFYLSEWFEIVRKSLQNTSLVGKMIYDWSKKTSDFFNKYIQIELYKNLLYGNIETFLPSFEIYAKIYELTDVYIFKNPALIEKFLNQNNYLIHPLKEYYLKIGEFFKGKIDNIYLEYENDFEEEFEAIFIIIQTNTNYKKSIKILDKFYEEYWLNLSDKIRQIVGVCIDENSK